MIQRIQSIYLILASAVSGGAIFVFDFWLDSSGESFRIVDAFKGENLFLKITALFFFGSSLLSLFTIFKFKKRQLQFVLGRLNILINLFLLGLLVYFSQNLSGEIEVSEKGIGLILPIVSIVLIVLANKAIKKDEDLVKSVDRLR